MAKKKPEVDEWAIGDDEGRFRFSVNGHTLSGVKHAGKWAFACDTWPDLVKPFNGSTGTADDVIKAFMDKALAGVATVKASLAAISRE